MALFYTDKTAKAEIAELNERIEALEADNTSAQEQIESISADLTTANESLTEANGQVESLTSDLEAANTALTEAQSELSTAQEELSTFDERVESAALAKFESLGGQPIKGSKSHDDKTNISELSGLEKAIAAHKRK